MNFKSSTYNHYFEQGGKKYIYNVLSTGIAELEEEAFESVKNNNLKNLTPDFIDGLYGEGMIVDTDTDEASLFEYYYDSKRYGDNSKVLKLTLVPTYGCNLACPYCFEGQLKETGKITKEKLDRSLIFLKNQIEEGESHVPVQEIRISFFGGEPLLCIDELSYFCKGARKIALEYDKKIVFDITTNLTLLNDRATELIREYDIALQVTIDGTREQHDKRRIYKNGKGSYDIIVKNLQKLKDAGLADLVTVRINLDSDNLNEANDILAEASKYTSSIYFGYLMPYKEKNDDYKNECFKKNCYSSVSVFLYDIYEKAGFRVPQEFGKKTPCELNSQNTFVIDCDADVYKCELLLGHKECKVGVLDENGEFRPNANFYKQMAYSPLKIEKCKGCKMLPMCGGGCPAREYINGERHDGNIYVGECANDENSLNEYLTDYVKRNP